MSASRKLSSHSRAVNLLLIAVILLTTVMPAHYHLHHLHNIDVGTHEHAIDLHFITASADQSHHDEGTSIFAATPDVIVKKGSFDVYPYLLLPLLLVLLTIFHRIGIRSGYGSIFFEQHPPYLSPPLRAPPAR